MRRTVAAAFVSLDGVMQAPGGPQEDPTGGFKHGGWTVPYWDAVESLRERRADRALRTRRRRQDRSFALEQPTAAEIERRKRLT